MKVTIDIVSDLVCPWCFIGKHRLQQALLQVGRKHPGVRFQRNWLPFFLNPDTPPEGEPYGAFLEAKFGGAKPVARLQQSVTEAGAESGLEFNFERITTRPNTLRAHRLVHRAQSIGHSPAEVEALVESLFAAHFQRGEDIGDVATLADIAAACGDRRETVRSYLASDAGAQQVMALAGQVGDLGVSGVPFFIIQRRLTVAGAPAGELLAATILQAIS
ncbi:MAG: DsbA family oxidoreductase [Candidatus Accumulibacter sp.]|uniref:DsbA family oxidoreductase n=1 Tax=Accumulibacter sp. TaxID=2053492 RepID=UPI0025E73CAE|nr:DsbA family oxidoreductase [Accumulibacter sp.]MCP5249386.1 DsbA family oxidoreductase [Accumulibacter sp.]